MADQSKYHTASSRCRPSFLIYPASLRRLSALPSDAAGAADAAGNHITVQGCPIAEISALYGRAAHRGVPTEAKLPTHGCCSCGWAQLLQAACGQRQDTRASSGKLAHGAVHHVNYIQYRSRMNQQHHQMQQELPISLILKTLCRCAPARRYRPFYVFTPSREICNII